MMELSFVLWMASSVGAVDMEHTVVKPLSRKKKFNTGQTWPERHEAVKQKSAEGKAQLIFMGDSITHYWETKAPEIWEDRYAPYDAINMGFSGDQTRHLIWRIQNGALDGISPKVAVIMIGTNNARNFSPEEVVFATRTICDLVHEKLPETKILLLGIFPRATDEGRARHLKNQTVNQAIAGFAEADWIEYLDLTDAFHDKTGVLPKATFPDGLHPNNAGYAVWAEAMQSKLDELLKD
jgi:lysophospholipase L1-like esterase